MADKPPRRPRAETPKGFRDYFGAEVTERKSMLDRIAAVYHRYGFDPLETSAVETVEALGKDGQLSAVQRGFHEKLGAQCGYCTPGFVMASVGLLRRNPNPTDDEILEALGSNICRCTGYVKIIEAVRYAASLGPQGVSP